MKSKSFMACFMTVLALSAKGHLKLCPIRNLCMTVSYCNTTIVISVDQQDATVSVPQNVDVTLQCFFHKHLGFIYKESKANRLTKMGSPLHVALARVRWPQDAVTYGCSKHSDIGPRFRLDITVPPTVFNMSVTSLRRDLHSAVQVNCTVYGNPIPTVGWVKMAKSLPTDFTLRTDELKGQIIPIVQSHLVVNVTSTGSYGRYSCQASNTVGTAERSFELKPIELPQVKLDPKIAPLLTTGGNISIVCQATGLPLPYVQWSRDGREIPIIESSSIHTMKSSSKNEIHLTNVSRSDAGWYTCSATTGPYIASQKTEIIVIGVPYKPRNVTIANVTYHSATISFSVFVDVSAPITSTSVWIRNDSHNLWEKAIETERNRLILINALRPSTLYQIKLTSSNEVGTSEFTPIMEFITQEIEPTPSLFLPFTQEQLSSDVFKETTRADSESTFNPPTPSASNSSTGLETILIAVIVPTIFFIFAIVVYRFYKRKRRNDYTTETKTVNDLSAEQSCRYSLRLPQPIPQGHEHNPERIHEGQGSQYGKFGYSQGSNVTAEYTEIRHPDLSISITETPYAVFKDRGIVHHNLPHRIPADECSNAPEEKYGKFGYSDHSHISQNKTKDTVTDQAQQHQPAAVCSSTHEPRYGKFGYPYPQSTTDHEVSNEVPTGDCPELQENENSQAQVPTLNND